MNVSCGGGSNSSFQSSSQSSGAPLLKITSNSLPTFQAGQIYQASLNASGGTSPYNWSIASGALPAGLTIQASSGVISGTPATAGHYSFTAQVKDTSTSAQQTADAPFSGTVEGPALQITTQGLPAIQQGQVFQSSLTAAGGTSPYNWSIASGVLPAGLSIDASSGVISGTPATAGPYSFVAQVKDSSTSSPEVANASYSGSVTASGTSLQITTNSLSAGVVGLAYTAQLSVIDGVTPYNWTLSSGALPAGLGLAGSGMITGTPTLPVQATVNLQVTDSSSPQKAASKTFTITVQNPLDAYGGSAQLPCPTGAASHFYTQKIGNRWWLCTPAGNAFWMKSVYVVDADNSTDSYGVNYYNIAAGKYGDADLRWGPQQNRRLQSWGFNSLAEYASLYTLPTTTNSSWPNSQQPVLMPFTGLAWPSYYSLSNSGGYAPGPAKELIRATNPAVFTGYRAHSPDPWDPNFATWLDGWLQHDYAGSQWINGPNNSYLIGFNVDDTDTLEGFGAGPDFKTVANGVASGGREQPHLGWIVLVTPPTQSQNTEFGVTYTDTTVYAKQALANFLQSRYATISALNTAWGSAYTTFGSAGGWGVGTGLLDEDGTHSWTPKDYTGLSDANAAVKKDLDDFLFLHAQKYFSVIKAELNARAPGRLYLGPTTLSTWGSPPRQQILQAAAGYIDVFSSSSIPSGVSDDQQRIDFIAQNLGDKPWLEWEGFVANPDSYMNAYAPNDEVQPLSSTQAQRAQIYSSMINLLVNARTSAGAYPVVGFKWWQFVDNRGEQMNWGLVTRRDNEYDGRAAVTAIGTDAWGFPTGGETNSYGDFLTTVQNSNLGILPTLLSKTW
ncbi:MAG: Ig domain-containing protein [Terriglobia bacterium]